MSDTAILQAMSGKTNKTIRNTVDCLSDVLKGLFNLFESYV